MFANYIKIGSHVTQGFCVSVGQIAFCLRGLKLHIIETTCTDSNQILHSDKDQQILFASCLKARKNNPRWWTAAILRNRKSVI